MLNEQQQRTPDAELPGDLHRVARGPVLDDPAVLEAADHDPAKGHAAAAMRAVEGPARSDAIALGDLLVDDEAKVGEELQVESDRASGAVVAPVLERVDVVDEVRVVDVGDPAQVLAGADLLERAASRFGCGPARARG